jgi:hypothetical protein
VYTLCKVVRSIAIAASSVQGAQGIVGFHVLGFLPSPIMECMVSRACSRLEERGSIYHVDPIGIIEVRGEEVLAPTLVGSRLWRWGPG